MLKKEVTVVCFALAMNFMAAPLVIGKVATSESIKQKAESWFIDVIEKENIKQIDALLSDHAVLELAPTYKSNITATNKVVGKEAIKKHMADFVGLTSAVISEDAETVAEGNKVAMYRLITTKYNNGKVIKTPWAIFFTFNNGKISYIKHVHDTLLEEQQNQAFSKSGKKSP